jgi:tRNA G18 (ribose-2'-O)-methylase SpoU
VVVVRISDGDHPALADYRDLTDAAARRRGDVFLCEGVLAIRRAHECGIAFHSVLLTPTKREHLADLQLDHETTVLEADLDVMRRVTGFDIHRGAVAAAVRPAERRVEDVVRTATTVAVLEGVNDLENLGALFRNAAAFGVDAVVLDPSTADPLARRAVRVSLGHVLAVPHARLHDWPDGLDRLGMELVALTPHGDETAVRADGRVALLLGAEGPGLSDAALAKAHRRVRIRMAPDVDSLNVATAAAIAFHQRFP